MSTFAAKADAARRRISSVDRDLNLITNGFFRHRLPAAVDKGIRKIVFDTGAELVRSLNGLGGVPKRIDTGRYRAAWVMGVEAGTGLKAGPASIMSRAGDGIAKIRVSGTRRSTTVTNNVRYGPYIEYGTARMPAGMHLERALRVMEAKVAALMGIEITAAWGA